MEDNKTFGSKRLVVGAHYGLRDWLSQRVTAALMAVFTLLLIVQVLFGPKLGYERWAQIFSAQWMKVLAFVTIVSLAWHAWVGMRDVLMDYVKPTGLRLTLEIAVLLVLAVYLGWTVQILWR